MKKIASINLDVVDYILNDVEKLAQVVDHLSDDAKTAYVPTFEEQQDMKDSKFGIILWGSNSSPLNKFALYSKDLVELNMAFLSDKKDVLPDEVVKIAATNLTCAAQTYNVDIPENLSEFKSNMYVNNMLNMNDIDELAFVEKVSETQDPSYAWKEEEKYPLNTTVMVKKATTYFSKHHTNMDMDKKLEFVLNVTKAAKSLDTSLDNTTLDKYASLNRAELNPDFENHIAIRKSYLKDNEEITIYDDLREKAESLAPTKVAQALAIIDSELGLNKNYGKGLEDPLVATLDEVKVAGMDIDGTFVTTESLQQLNNDDLTSIVGNDVIGELKSDEGVDVLASLPIPVRREVIDLM